MTRIENEAYGLFGEMRQLTEAEQEMRDPLYKEILKPVGIDFSEFSE